MDISTGETDHFKILKILKASSCRKHQASWSVNTEAAWSCRVCHICQVTTVGLQARNFTAWIDRFLVFIFHSPGKHDVAQSNMSPSLYWPKWIQMACRSCKYCSQPDYCVILDENDETHLDAKSSFCLFLFIITHYKKGAFDSMVNYMFFAALVWSPYKYIYI